MSKLFALVVASLALCAAPASAAVSVSASGDTLTVSGSGGSDNPRFNYLDPAPGGPGYTRIYDSGGVADPALPCFRPANDPFGQDEAHVALCEDGGTATLLTNLIVNLGDGPDSPLIEACFNTIDLDLGEGANTGRPPLCPAGTFVVRSGSGPDRIAPQTSGRMAITADLGAGEDQFTGSDVDDVVAAGPGVDRLYGLSGNDTLGGGADNDELSGGPGDDTLAGGDGDDGLERAEGVGNDEGLGRDTYNGGAGTDRLWLDDHHGAVTISLNGAADDGVPGEGDNVGADVEEFEGTEGDDVFEGSGGSETFYGRSGNDTLRGGGGSDLLEGASGSDTIDGGPGTDRLYGDGITCYLACVGDPDRLFARDGEQDTVNCGNGGDTAQVDQLDVVGSCAAVDRGGDQNGGGDDRKPDQPRVASFATAGPLSRAKGIKLRVTCPASCSFKAQLTIAPKVARKAKLGRKAVTIGTAKGALTAAGEQSVTLKLSAKAKKRLRKLKSVPATLTVTVTDAAGTTSSKRALKLVR